MTFLLKKNFIITKVAKRQILKHDKFCKVFIFLKEWTKNMLNKYAKNMLDLSNFESFWIEKSNVQLNV